MDHHFPSQLFPSFYNCGPPDAVPNLGGGNWGSYDGVRPQKGSGPLSSWTFTSRRRLRGELWCHAEPVPVPLFSPKKAFRWSSTPPDPLAFTEHMQNFYMDHRQVAFGCLSGILGEHFKFQSGNSGQHRKDAVNVWATKFIDMLNLKICHQTYSSNSLEHYSGLMSDFLHQIPPELLGPLLYEELTEQRKRMLFSEEATGGALAFIPFSQSGGSSQHGCLLYPGSRALDCLNFHRVALQQQHGEGAHCVDASSSKPFRFQLKAPIRQISAASLFNDCCVAVRSTCLCGVWRFGEHDEPRLLQVVNTKEVATCVSVSPHILGEVLVASESGAANLWTVGKGMQKVREEESNLYFNAKSPWRWCEFTAHPRVMVYADRTGAELSDMRMSAASNQTLFHISKIPECRSGERVILSKYLSDVHTFHHLITTQYSAYMVDERFPCVPMLKWDHMMQSPPMFCHVLPGPRGGGARSAKILLGSQSSQEITLLQYSGGRKEACVNEGSPQALLRPRDSLKHLPVQIPHRLQTATNRLSAQAAGLTCIHKRAGREEVGRECICVLQLTEAGDIFYQVLEHRQPGASRPPVAEDEPLPPQAANTLPQPAVEKVASGGKNGKQLPALHSTRQDSQLAILETSSDDDVIGPTAGAASQSFVAETPPWKQRRGVVDSDGSSEDSEPGRKRRKRHRLRLEVVVNVDPELDQRVGLSAGEENENTPKSGAAGPEKPDVDEEAGSSASRAVPRERQTPVKLSDGVLDTWKRWLQKVMRKSRKKRRCGRSQRHLNISTERLLRLPSDKVRALSEGENLQSVRRELKACMSSQLLVVNGAVPAAPSEVVPFPDQVEMGEWTDGFNQRLTLSWQGEEAWRSWWEENLGLNRKEKAEALRKRRRREKEAKRAGRRRAISGSFTSSVSYQSELDDFSDSTGWSSGTSQGLASDTEEVGALSQPDGVAGAGVPRATTPTAVQSDNPVPTPAATPQRVRDEQDDHQAPDSCGAVALYQAPGAAPASKRRGKRLAQDCLGALFTSQDESSQHDGYFLDAGDPLPPPGTFSQLSTFSQSSLSQSSQGRLGLSQGSQPKKKKSRMGF